MPPVKTLRNDTDVVVPKAGETYVSEDGTVSQVLDDHIDANYEPTEEEVLEFADWIGMKLPEDSEYLWLAREGLKTPLPKEWKPCSTNDGEVYYFNFKTGESSWDHPMDSLFRQRFEQEKEKARKGGKAAPAAGGKTTAAANTNLSRGGSELSNSNSANIIQPIRVIITETGVTRRDGGLAAGASSSSSPTAGTSSGNRGGGGAKGDKAATRITLPLPQQDTSGAAVNNDPRSSASVPSRASPLAGSAKSVGLDGSAAVDAPTRSKGNVPMVSSPTTTAAPASVLAAPRRIVSEAERAMEEKVQREVQNAFEAEKAKLTEAHQGTLTSLKQLLEKDMADIRAADEARRAAMNKQEDEERERRLHQTREKCEEQYGDELRMMEREEETLKSRLQKMEAEATRAASGNTQRAQIEEQMRNALAKQRADLEATMKRQRDAAVAAEAAAHSAALKKIAQEAQEKVSALEQASVRKMDAAERATALEVEAEKKKLESRLKDLERQLAEKATEAPSNNKDDNISKKGAAATSGSSLSLSDELARISSAKAAKLREIEVESKREREAVQSKGEAALCEVTQQLQQSLSSSSSQSTPTSRAPFFSCERPMSVMMQGGSGVGGNSFAGSRTASGTLSVAYTQELNRIRMARAKERQERLAQLRVERDAAIAAASVSPARTFGANGQATASPGDAEFDPLTTTTLEELKAAHAEELDVKKALYARLEAELKAQLAQEATNAAAATTAEQQSALVAKAVDAEMELYTQEVLARHARMKLEADAKREKLLADHQLALEAYERKKSEMEARLAREEQEAKEAFIQEKVDAAVKAEMARLEAEHATAMARLTARYGEEREAAKGEVEEEIEAYEQTERQKILAAAESAIAAVGPQAVQKTLQQQHQQPQPLTSVTPQSVTVDPDAAAAATAAIETRCTQVSQRLTERGAKWVADKRAFRVQRETLEAKRTTLVGQQQHHEEHLKVLQDENANAAAALETAEAERDRARRSATGATPPSQPTATASPCAAPPSGYRARTAHEAAMRALEDGYRAEQSALEGDLRSWRTKVQQLLQDQQVRRASQVPAAAASTLGNTSSGGTGSFVNNGLNTPRQQVLSDPCNPGAGPAAATAATMMGSMHRTPVLSHASPIASAAAGPSLSNTPIFSMPFGDSPWVPQQQLQFMTPPKAALGGVLSYDGGLRLSGSGAVVERSLLPTTTTLGGSDAVSYSREHQQSLLRRQASLQAARDAWQQERARELQQHQIQQLRIQQQQRCLLLPTASSYTAATSSFSKSNRCDSLEIEGSRQRRAFTPHRQPSPHPQDQLSLVLSKLSYRLDSLAGQAEQLQRRRSRSEHMDPRSVTGDKRSDEIGLLSRSGVTHSRQQLSSPQQHVSANEVKKPNPSGSTTVLSSSAAAAQRRASHSPHPRSQNSSRHEDDTFSSKWGQLLSVYDRN